jgi:hypothetical protein
LLKQIERVQEEVPAGVNELFSRLAKIEQSIQNPDVSKLEQLLTRLDLLEKANNQKTTKVEYNADVLNRVESLEKALSDQATYMLKLEQQAKTKQTTDVDVRLANLEGGLKSQNAELKVIETNKHEH